MVGRTEHEAARASTLQLCRAVPFHARSWGAEVAVLRLDEELAATRLDIEASQAERAELENDIVSPHPTGCCASGLPAGAVAQKF